MYLMKQALLFLLVTVSLHLGAYGLPAAAIQTDEQIKQQWEAYKSKYGKNYAIDEDNKRLNMFLETKERVERHNREYLDGKHTFEMGMNYFADMFLEERRSRNGFRSTKNFTLSKNFDVAFDGDNVDLPAHVDWRKHGYVTKVKDQGHCGSCWAFSSTGSLEAQHMRKTGQLVSLSEQNLVDCSKNGNMGCGGGLMDTAFRFVQQNGGLDTESSYPYRAEDEKCHFSNDTIGTKVIGFVNLPFGDEKKLRAAVATQGPIAVAIDASPLTFSFYRSGIYYEPECSNVFLDHAVLVVGYGRDKHSNQDYWIVKNSWNEDWGDKGYIKMIRNRGNNCGIASAASYPLV